MKKLNTLLILLFIVLYSIFVFKVNLNVSLDFAAQIIVAGSFFFALFSGFFIARQNDRYTRVVDIIAERDALYSYIYRAFSLIPRIQAEIKEAVGNHYKKILDSGDWAYNEFHPSNTITKITLAMGSVTDQEGEKLKNNNLFDSIWGAVQDLQVARKKIIVAYEERLLLYQWIIIYIFAALTIVSFHFLQTTLLWLNILKIIFATSVFLVIILIKQLDELSIFGKDFSHRIANDVLRIINEADAKELEKS